MIPVKGLSKDFIFIFHHKNSYKYGFINDDITDITIIR